MNAIPNEALLREQLVEAAGWVREQLRRADVSSTFQLDVKIEGPIQFEDGAKLVYRLDCTSNYGNAVMGNNLAEVTFELLRRMGWKSRNAGLQLNWSPPAEAPEAPAAPSLDTEN